MQWLLSVYLYFMIISLSREYYDVGLVMKMTMSCAPIHLDVVTAGVEHD